jgi:hypothetical protein
LRRALALLVFALAVALAAPLAASAGQRMYFGFQDDQNFRFIPDSKAEVERAASLGSTVVRITVEWSQAAPTRPASPANPFDPTYRLDDVDALVRNAQADGMEVLLTIWGVPSWANGGRGPNFAPRNMNDLRNFARALGTRYSGRFTGYPYVRFWSVWNESNLEQFLAPQFNARGRSVAPATYARLYKAAYDGIRAGNSSALVAIGEVSPRGRDKPSPGRAQDSHSPGRFMQLVAQANRRLKFAAVAIHPYATSPTARPTQRVRWPNVTLGNLRRFETSVDTWFRRKNTPIWITEYGYQTRPQRPDGVSYATQRRYGQQAFNIARNDPRVQMFVWFIFRDSPKTTGQQWQFAGGVVAVTNSAKPAYSMFAARAPAVDARNAIYSFRAGTRNPTIRVAALELKAQAETGATVGINYRIFRGNRLEGQAIASSRLGRDGWISFRAALTVKRRTTYRLELTATDRNGNSVDRSITVRAS